MSPTTLDDMVFTDQSVLGFVILPFRLLQVRATLEVYISISQHTVRV